jgi:malate permease and related proteins
MNIRNTVKQASIYILSFNKLLLVPALLSVVYLLFFKLLGVQIGKEAFFVLILQAAMPCQTIVVVLSHRYNGDYQLAGANLFISTILSVATLPLIFYIVEQFWMMLL